MSPENTELRFLQISDTHFGPTKDFTIFGKVPYLDFAKVLSKIQNLKFQYDFIIHTGDVVSLQDKAAYKIAEEQLSFLNRQLYFVTGNHDDPRLLKNFGLFAEKLDLSSDEGEVSYYFGTKGYLNIVLDVKHPDDSNPSGVLKDSTLHAFQRLLESTKEPFVLFTHFPIHKIGALWVDTNLLIKDGEKIHALCVKYKERCKGVFYGHIHQPTINVVDGIQYISCASTSFQLGGWPNDVEIISHEEQTPPGFSYVRMNEQGTFIRFVAL